MEMTRHWKVKHLTGELTAYSVPNNVGFLRSTAMAKWPKHTCVCTDAFFGTELATLPAAGFAIRTALVGKTVPLT